ncbi:MAG: DUF222 domain-containing protein, partial [Acidimicrobiia bacterium]
MKIDTRTSGGVLDLHGDFPTRDVRVLCEEFATVSDDDLESWIVATNHHIDALRARWLVGIAEYDRRQTSQINHQLSTVGWLRSTLRVTGRVASTLIRTARGLVAMPTVARGALTGEIPPDAVVQLDQARRRHRDEFAGHETVFADAATYLDPVQLRRAIGYWEQQIDYPSAVIRVRKQRARRRLSINETFDGMWLINGELDPHTGAVVSKAIDHACRSAYLDPTDRRTPWQIRADILGDICEQSLRHTTTTSKGAKPHVTVTVDTQVLLRLRQGFATIDNNPIPET